MAKTKQNLPAVRRKALGNKHQPVINKTSQVIARTKTNVVSPLSRWKSQPLPNDRIIELGDDDGEDVASHTRTTYLPSPRESIASASIPPSRKRQREYEDPSDLSTHLRRILSIFESERADESDNQHDSRRSYGLIHSWKVEEKMMLCIIHRFFIIEWPDTAQLMNARFPSKQKPFEAKMVRSCWTQMHDPKAGADDQEAWSIVWGDRNFNEAITVNYQAILVIQYYAKELEIRLERRKSDDPRQKKKPVKKVRRSGRGRGRKLDSLNTMVLTAPGQGITTSTTQLTRRLTNSTTNRPLPDVNQAPTIPPQSLARRMVAVVIPPRSTPVLYNPINGRSIFSFIFHVLTCSGLSAANVAAHSSQMPETLYRAYSSESSGLNSPHVILAGRYNIFPYECTEAPYDSQSDEFIDCFVKHLIREEQPSPFISAAQSLVWGFHMLYRLNHITARFSIINGPLAQQDTSVYHAGSILSKLKKTQPRLEHMRYRGSQEILIFGEITNDAIYSTIKLESLEELAKDSDEVDSLLRLQVLRGSSRVKVARDQFLKEQVILDGSVGKAMALILRLFEFSPATKGAIITELVYRILQGWAVKIPLDQRSSEQAFTVFFSVFVDGCPKSLSHAALEEILRDAFMRGVHLAAQALLLEKRKRPNSNVRKSQRAFIQRNSGI